MIPDFNKHTEKLKTLEQRRWRAPLKVPYNLSTTIVQDKPVLKAISAYLELKPTFYSGVIKNAKARRQEIAEYLQISPRTLHVRLAWLKKHEFIWHDQHKNLYLCSHEKFCNKINIIFKSNIKHRRKCYEISNDGLTEYVIRSLAIHESRLKQNEAAKAKVFSKERYDERAYKDIQKGIEPPKTWAQYHQSLTHYTYVNKTLRNQKKILLNFYTATAPAPVNLLQQYEEVYDSCMKEGEDAAINPHCTLSCAGVARLLCGNDYASNGHYWEQKLRAIGLLQISPHHIRLERYSPYCYKVRPYRGKLGGKGYYDPLKEERVSLYQRKTKYREVLYFRTLPNKLVPLIGMTQTVAGVQLRLSLT